MNLGVLTVQVSPGAHSAAPTLLPAPVCPPPAPGAGQGLRRILPAPRHSAAGTPWAIEARCRWHTVPPIPNLPAPRALAITLQGLEEVVLVDSRQSLRQGTGPPPPGLGRSGRNWLAPCPPRPHSVSQVGWVVSSTAWAWPVCSRAVGWSCCQSGISSPESARVRTRALRKTSGFAPARAYVLGDLRQVT